MACGILFVAAFVLYGNTIPHGYALDDAVVITDNKFTQQGFAGIADIFSYDSFKGHGDHILHSVSGGRYRPLSIATFAVEYGLFGESPRMSHFVNVLIYACTAVLLFIVLNMLLKGLPRTNVFLSVPFFATLVFIAHPVHTEVVANIKSRDELLSFLFALAAMYCALRSLETGKMLFAILSGVCLFLALLSKEIAIVFVVIIPLSLYFFTKADVKKIVTSAVPLLIVAALFMALRYVVISRTALQEGVVVSQVHLMNDSFLEMSASQKYATITYTLGYYIKLLLVPHPLTWDYYPYHIPIMQWSNIKVLLSLVGYIALVGFAVKGLKQKKFYAYCILIFLIPLSLTANIVFPVGAFLAERFLYLPSLGFALLLAYIAVQQQYVKNPFFILLPVLLLYSVKTIGRNPAWKDSFTIIETDVKTSSGSMKVNLEYGKQLYARADKTNSAEERARYYDLALPHLEKAFKIFPNDATCNFILGTIYGRHKNDLEKAIYHLNNARQLNPNDVDTYNNLGTAYGLTKQYTKAVETYEEGLKRFPDDAGLVKGLGITRERMAAGNQ